MPRPARVQFTGADDQAGTRNGAIAGARVASAVGVVFWSAVARRRFHLLRQLWHFKRRRLQDGSGRACEKCLPTARRAGCNAGSRNVGTSFSSFFLQAWKKRGRTERRKNDMIADRNPRQRRKPRRTGGGASCRCVASLGDYAGFDRFGRVVDHLWYAYGVSVDLDRYTYGYDRASNRRYRENTLTTGRDELYGYDGVDRLIAFQHGDLNANKDSSTGTPAREDDWSLDMTGNWPGYGQKTSGSTDLDQGRTHNPVDEIGAALNWYDTLPDAMKPPIGVSPGVGDASAVFANSGGGQGVVGSGRGRKWPLCGIGARQRAPSCIAGVSR